MRRTESLAPPDRPMSRMRSRKPRKPPDTPAAPAIQPGRRWVTAVVVVGVAVAGLAAAVGVYYWSRPAPPRPEPASAPLRPLTTSPFLNTQPGVAYVRH